MGEWSGRENLTLGDVGARKKRKNALLLARSIKTHMFYERILYSEAEWLGHGVGHHGDSENAPTSLNKLDAQRLA